MEEILLRIGIREINDSIKETVNQTFTSIELKLKDKNYNFNIKIQDYESLKKEFNEYKIKWFEENNIKGLSESNKKIILFNNSFFKDTTNINKQSVFLHEIGHITNPLPNNIKGFDMSIIYKEFLADNFLFKIDENIFNKGRVEEDVKLTNFNNIKENINKIKNNNINYPNQDIIVKFIMVGGRFSYYDSFHRENLLINKVNDLIKFIKEQISEKN